MATESTLGPDALLEAVAGLGWPTLGHSRAGRPIHVGRFPGRQADLPPLVVMGGIHGDEPSSVGAILDLIMRWGRFPPAPGPTIVVPALNPDGVARGRKNSDADVDLNRNFPARNFVTTHAPGYDPGPTPLSEPETALFARLLIESGARAVVAVHAPFACINLDGPAEAWAASVAAASGWPVRENIGYPTPGSLGSYWGVDRGLPILTVELPPGPLNAFREPAFRALKAAVGHAPAGSAPRAM